MISDKAWEKLEFSLAIIAGSMLGVCVIGFIICMIWLIFE